MTTLPRDFFTDQPLEFTANTVVEIDVPSGRLIAADSLRSVKHFDVKPPQSINYGSGLDALAQLLAQQTNTAYAFVGNTCPTIVRQPDGHLEVISPDLDEDTDKEIFNDGETAVAEICTDFWATMLTDYQNWLDHGGADINVVNDKYALQKYTVFEVTPGKYRWTVFSHADRFDMDAEGRIVYSRLELIEAH